MSDAPWIRFFPSDWLAGTRGMSAAETGVYITLVMMMYEAKAPIRDDEARLARLCGLPPATFRKIRAVLVEEGKLVVEGGCLWNARVAAELGIRDERSDAARRSAKSRWSKSADKSTADPCERNADEVRSECLPEARTEEGSLRSPSSELRDQAKAPADERIAPDDRSTTEPDRKPPKRARRLPSDWQPSEAGRLFALEHGFTEPEITIETERIRNWSASSKNGAKLDWDAVWRNWILRKAEERPRQRGERRDARAPGFDFPAASGAHDTIRAGFAAVLGERLGADPRGLAPARRTGTDG